MTNVIYSLRKGRGPLLVSMPHIGTVIPGDIECDMTEIATRRDDTDWHLDVLYDFLDELDATVLTPVYSRYVVDLNRRPDGVSMYPGQSNTPVCPVDTFRCEPLYRPGRAPDANAVAKRIEMYWQPYHDALAAELRRIRSEHGVALLWDAHSVRSEVPRFFEGRLPDINLGTVDGSSCGEGLGERLLEVAGASDGYSAVLNGRFVGGYVTRAHGKPAAGVHAVQLELAQITYMQEAPPYAFDVARAASIRPVLKALLAAALDWTRARRSS